MRSCEKISQPSMLRSSRKNFALRTRYKRSLGRGDTLGVCRESAKTGRKVIFSHPPRNSASLIRGAAPETPRFIALGPESLCYIGADCTAPAIPASGSTLGSHLCVAFILRPDIFRMENINPAVQCLFIERPLPP